MMAGATPASRHAELVSASIPVHQTERLGQVAPFRVSRLDQIDFPRPVPILELFLARDGIGHVVEHLDMDEPVDGIASDETVRLATTMLPQSLGEVRGDADIKRASRLAGKDVDARVALGRHAPVIAAQWMLKQVQHDGREVMGPLTRPEHRFASPGLGVRSDCKWQASRTVAL